VQRTIRTPATRRLIQPVRAIPRLRGLPVLGFAAAGLLVGHAISYLLVVPDPNHRDLVLSRTGHGYLPAAGDAALILALAGMAALVVRAWSERGREEPRTFASLASLLAIVQVVAFAGLEVLERLVAGAPLGDLIHEHLLVIGVAVQIAVALVGALALRWIASTAARIADLVPVRAALPRPALAAAVPATPDLHRVRLAASARSVRAPPSP
jgi:hypothetical protein